jgi:hypothetical protein
MLHQQVPAISQGLPETTPLQMTRFSLVNWNLSGAPLSRTTGLSKEAPSASAPTRLCVWPQQKLDQEALPHARHLRCRGLGEKRGKFDGIPSTFSAPRRRPTPPTIRVPRQWTDP